jgi:hypothetical protein
VPLPFLLQQPYDENYDLFGGRNYLTEDDNLILDSMTAAQGLSKLKRVEIPKENLEKPLNPAAQLARANFRDLEGTSFFAKFSASAAKGELIQKFLQTADSRTPVEQITLSLTPTPPRTPATTTLPASFNPIQTPAGPGILITLSPPPNSPPA